MSGTEGVPVRGSCAAGHVTETRSDKGRYTWEGVCSHDGCDLPVKAKRIPKDQVPKPPADPADGATRVVRVADYDDTSHGRQDDHGGLAVAEVDAGELVASGSADEPVGGPPDPLDERGERSTALSRFRERRAARSAGQRRPRTYQHPLIGG